MFLLKGTRALHKLRFLLEREPFVEYSHIHTACTEAVFSRTVLGTEQGVAHDRGEKVRKAHCLRNITSLRTGEHREAIM